MSNKQAKSSKYPDLIKLVEKYQSDEQLKRGIKILESNRRIGIINAVDYLKSGDKVKLNMQAITSDPDWITKQNSYREYCTSHADDVFTVMIDPKFGNEPAIVSLLANGTDTGWYFYTGDLIVEKENPS